MVRLSLAFSLIFLICEPALSQDFQLPLSGNQVVGSLRVIKTIPGDTLYTVARRYEVGRNALKMANPTLPQYSHIQPETDITIPSLYVLPKKDYHGIIVNVPELRLYYYSPDEQTVLIEPVSVGRPGWPTPNFDGIVIEKIDGPEWRVPPSIWDFSAAKGVILPKVVPPGPDNPLGQYALRLNAHDVLIHGTNQPDLIGKRVSSGCIRMYPEDIENLFNKVALNTQVFIVDQPYKVGWQDNKLYLEVHPPLAETSGTFEEEREKVKEIIETALKSPLQEIDWDKVDSMLQAQTGVPQVINAPQTRQIEANRLNLNSFF